MEIYISAPPQPRKEPFSYSTENKNFQAKRYLPSTTFTLDCSRCPLTVSRVRRKLRELPHKITLEKNSISEFRVAGEEEGFTDLESNQAGSETFSQWSSSFTSAAERDIWILAAKSEGRWRRGCRWAAMQEGTKDSGEFQSRRVDNRKPPSRRNF